MSVTVSCCIISKYFVLLQTEVFFSYFLEDGLLAPLRGEAFSFVFLGRLKAGLSPIYTGGMNLPIYGAGMAELQSAWHLSLDGAAVCIAQWRALCQGPLDADMSFSHANIGFSLNIKVNMYRGMGR